MSNVSLPVLQLSQHKVIAYPTETLWGLGVDAFNENAVDALFELKGRDISKAVSVLVRDIEHARELAEISPAAEKFLQMVWPGPVTVVLPRKSEKLDKVCAGGPTIGLRCSSHEYIQKLVWSYENPITTTSANPSGQPSAQVRADLKWLPEEVFVCPYEDPVSAIESQGSSVVLWTDSGLKIFREGDVAATLLHKIASECLAL